MVRSSQYGMKEPSSHSNGAPKAQRTRHKRILLGLALVLVAPWFWLATPAGQRAAVRFAVSQLNGALPDSQRPLRITVGGVGLGHRPIGISVEDFVLKIDEPEGDTLLAISNMSAQPDGLSTVNWNAIRIDGVSASPDLLDWIQEWMAANQAPSSSENSDFRISSFTATDVQWSFDSLSADFLQLDKIQLSSLHLSGLDQNSGVWQLDDIQTQMDIYASTLAQDKFGFEIQVEGNASEWNATANRHGGIAPSWGEWDDRWCPDSLTLSGRGPSDEIAVSFQNEHLQADFQGSLSGDSVRFHRLDLESDDLSKWSASLPRLSAALTLYGPLSAPFSSAPLQGVQWGLLDLNGGLSWEARVINQTGQNSTANGHWTPASGQVSLAMQVDPRCLSELNGHGPSLDLQGFVPPWSPNPLRPSASLNGSWSIAHLGAGNGLTANEGDLGIMLSQDTAGSWTIKSSLEAQLAPLVLGETLDLHGQFAAQAQVVLTAEGDLSTWSSRLDIDRAKWVPHPQFGLRQVKTSAPLSMRKLSLTAMGNDARFNAELDGDFVRGSLEGPLRLDAWLRPFESALASGGFWPQPVHSSPAPDWSIDLRVLRDDLLERYSGGTQSVGPYSKLVAENKSGELTVDLKLTSLHVGPLQTRRLQFNGRGGVNSLTAQLDVDRVRIGEWTPVDALHMAASVDLDATSEVDVTWTGPVQGQIHVNHQLLSDNRHVLLPTLASLQHASGDWNLNTLGQPQLSWPHEDWRALQVENVDFIGSLGSISIASPDSSLLKDANFNVRLNGVPLNAISEWTSQTMAPSPPSFSGTLNGDVALDLRQEQAFAGIQWQDAFVGAFDLGDLCLSLLWDESLSAKLQQFVGEQEVMTANIADDNKTRIEFTAWPVEMLNPILLKGDVSIAGTADGSVDMDWSNGMPVAKGELDLDAHSIQVGATGGEHSLSGVLRIDPDFIGMDQAIVLDPDSNRAKLNLSVLHTDFASWNYDLGLSLEEGPFRVMDLQQLPSRLFFGTVYATGNLDVYGDESGLYLEAEVKSQSGTKFTLPLDALEGADMPSGIRFVGGTARAPQPVQKAPFGLTLDVELDITPDAELNLVLDSEAGERVDGLAQGHLAISMSPDWPLSIQGGLDIQEGQYRFSLRDLFTKRIDLAPGGRLDWDGDPYSAEFDLLALSNLRSNPRPLIPDYPEDIQKTPVQVGMGIHGRLEAPILDFVVTFPEYEVSEPTKLLAVQSAMSTPEETERQAFALLATGQFIPVSGTGDVISQIPVAQASELVSSRVSELLSGLSEDVDIGLRYVPSTEAGNTAGALDDSEDAFELDLGVNLINNRLRIMGTIGTQTGETNSPDDAGFSKGVDVRYKLTTDGRWELRGYSLPGSQLERDFPKRAIGAAYQIRFNRLRNLFRSTPSPSSPESP